MECIHGNLKEQERDKIMINFLEKKLDLIVCRNYNRSWFRQSKRKHYSN